MAIPAGTDFEGLCRRLYGDELMRRCKRPTGNDRERRHVSRGYLMYGEQQ